MGIKKGLTHAPEEMKELKDITLNNKFIEGMRNNIGGRLYSRYMFESYSYRVSKNSSEFIRNITN